MRSELEAVNVFLAVAELRSFRAAGERLGRRRLDCRGVDQKGLDAQQGAEILPLYIRFHHADGDSHLLR